jgi:hypothetical protein
MQSLAELLRFSLDQIRADGPTEMIYECNEDGLHIRARIDGNWHRVVPVSTAMLTKRYGLRGDLFGAVLAFFRAEAQSTSSMTSDGARPGDAGVVQWEADGTRIRVTWK